ncbi:hypothetical protein ACU6T4_10935 [Avibacterium paragallinarum]|uniref:hypothetical protein n=1 Tax=Avibacterium paragallinarum TaxID=728 RepID=UPI00021AD39E|nr:hypothetical protein [Avibacterium paragallinarum]AZI13643.1 hypothetical protein EIA51_02695 [Avibacterium paragallinarum]QIR12043.1 hypothetical protein HBL79_07240 [Avibacterium paragallinarum]QJE09137.1 hypothetical protein HHJ62_01800 [Avibacterium paragallinarum]QJE11333.1 hypothetical protein HHJ61_01800 [Avibacterium paragallinarum]QJE13531.1 hypothetical protein HHJ60_01810 [Avibacterium paragallinarum]
MRNSKFKTILGVRVQKQIYSLIDQSEMLSNDFDLIRSLLNTVAFTRNKAETEQERISMVMEALPKTLYEAKKTLQIIDEWYQEQKETIQKEVRSEATEKFKATIRAKRGQMFI